MLYVLRLIQQRASDLRSKHFKDVAGWSLVISSLLLRWIQNGMERKIEFIPKVMKACSGRQIDFSLKVQ
jgi:hypothetical protein